MIYKILGKLRDPYTDFVTVDEIDDLVAAKIELYNLKRDHPLWEFKIEEEINDRQIQEGIRSEPELPV